MKEKLCEKLECTGCSACVNACGHSCITMITSEEGFIYPSIDAEKCIDCNQCSNACPVLERPSVSERIYPVSYASIIEDKEILMNSASGGMFRAFADQWDGSVYGAYMLEDYSVHIKRAESVDDLKAMQGSKYVFSNMDEIYKTIKLELINNQNVLFFGLPCQVAGLRKYLKIEYANLLCVDIVCHGTPSTKLYQDYIMSLEREYGKIDTICFTDKSRRWVPLIERNTRIEVNDKAITRDFTEDPFMTMFINEWIYRESCYKCKFADIYRMGDITIGDFFGLGIRKKYNDDASRGVSQVLINTIKGKNFFDSLKGIRSTHRELEECLLGNKNLWKPSHRPEVRSHIYSEYIEYGFDYLVKHYCEPYSNTLSTKLKYKMRRYMPRLVTRLILRQSQKICFSESLMIKLQDMKNKLNAEER